MIGLLCRAEPTLGRCSSGAGILHRFSSAKAGLHFTLCPCHRITRGIWQPSRTLTQVLRSSCGLCRLRPSDAKMQHCAPSLVQRWRLESPIVICGVMRVSPRLQFVAHLDKWRLEMLATYCLWHSVVWASQAVADVKACETNPVKFRPTASSSCATGAGL